MLKTISVLIISFSLSLSIVAPSIVLLFDLDTTSIAMVELIEEEPLKKSTKKVDDSKFLNKINSEIDLISFKKSNRLFEYRQTIMSSYYLKIHLPPPRILS
jgi:hypothetical protein